MKLKRSVRYLLFLAVLFSASGHAQTLEPRQYANAPVGMNFLVAGYAFSQGAPSLNPELGLEDPHINIHTSLLAYARVIDLFGQSGKVNVVVPGVCLDGYAFSKGERLTRNVCGAGDIKAGISWNIYGAPALSMKEFASYRSDTVVGVSLQVTAPTGQYDNTKLVNISANRWAFKPSIGVSQTVDDFVFELSAAAELYTENTDVYGGNTRKQEPIYVTQAHLIYNIMPGMWAAFDANYYWGGATVVNGERNDDAFSNSRMGATLALPVNRKNSIKVYASSGVDTRAGTDFDLVGIAWQIRWGGGLK